MDRDKRPKSHKLGPNRGEEAVKRRKVRVNFSESRDIREDRGTRQDKLASRKQPEAGRGDRAAKSRAARKPAGVS